MAVFKIETPALPDFRITQLAFKQRFTQTERIAIRSAAAANPVVDDFLDLMNTAIFVDLARQDTVSGVAAMEQLGLLDAGRADEILTAPIQEIERPKV